MNAPPPPPGSGDSPHQRRADDGDLTASDAKLILYQLGELKAAVSEGFAKIEGRFDRVEDRVSSLERFRERQEERDRADANAAQNVNSRWVPVFLGLLAVGVTIAIALSQGAGT